MRNGMGDLYGMGISGHKWAWVDVKGQGSLLDEVKRWVGIGEHGWAWFLTR